MAMRIIGSQLKCKNGHQHKTITRSPVFLWDVDLRSKYGGKYDPSYCKNYSGILVKMPAFMHFKPLSPKKGGV